MTASAAADQHFAEFVEVNSGALLRTAFLLTRSHDAAAELVQDTFATLYPRWHKVIAADSAPAYVRAALVNRHLSRRRSRAYRGETHESVDTQAVAIGDFTGPISDRAELRQLLAKLSDRQRTAIVLRYFLDLNDTQIAADMGCRVGTVRSLISRALTTLRSDAAALDHERTS